MEAIIKAMVDEDVSADQFLSFATDYGIQDEPYIQEVLVSRKGDECRQSSGMDCSRRRRSVGALKIPRKNKTQPRAPLKQLQTNAGASTSRAEVGTLSFECQQCHKTFTQKRNLVRQLKSAHNQVKFGCSKCRKTFSRQMNLRQHETACQDIVTYPCDKCAEVLKTARELEFHQKLKHKPQKRPAKENIGAPAAKRRIPHPGPSTYNCRQCEAKFEHPKQLQVHNARQHGRRGVKPHSPRAARPCTYNCRRCPAQFRDRRALHVHNVQAHYQTGAGLHAEPFQRGQEPWVNEDDTVDQGFRDCYRTNRALILERYRLGPVESLYNIPMFPGMRIWDIGQALQGIYDRQRHAFKVNLSFGFIMRHVETDEYRFFRPFDNVNVFDAPILISRRSDIGKVLKKLKELDVMAEMSKIDPIRNDPDVSQENQPQISTTPISRWA